MSDEIKSNLEPIDEGDLNLKEKFLGGATSSAEKSEQKPEQVAEQLPVQEQAVEKKEGVVEKEAAYAKILSKMPSPTPTVVSSDQDVATDASGLKNGMDEESKIKTLVNLAEMKGIPHAVKVAKHYEDNYLLDEFHDRMLGDVLHDALVAKGMIKEM